MRIRAPVLPSPIWSIRSLNFGASRTILLPSRRACAPRVCRRRLRIAWPWAAKGFAARRIAFLMHSAPQPSSEDRSRFGIALVAAAALGLVVVLFFYLFSSGPHRGTPREAQLPFGPVEQAYASRVEFRNFSMSR